MNVSTNEIVSHVISHERRLAKEGGYNWPAAKGALTRVLAELEARSPEDPSLDRLRAFIALGDRSFAPHKTKA